MAGFHDCMLSNRYGLLKVKSMLSGQHEVCATSWWPRERAAFTWSSVVKAAVGLVLEWKRAAITTGRLASTASSSR